MRVYNLTAQDLAPFGYAERDIVPVVYRKDIVSHLRFANTEEVDHPSKADFFFIPIPLRSSTMDRHKLKAIIDHHRLDERRVVAYDCSDETEDYSSTNPNCLFIRCSAKGWYVRCMPRTISWPWPVEDWKDIVPVPEGGFKYDVSGHMWLSHEIRVSACASVKKTFGSRADILTRPSAEDSDGFYGHIKDPAKLERLKAAMKASMAQSRVALCPASIPAVFPYRYFEALSAGRVPVLFCTDMVFPWANKIDYKSFGPIFDEWAAKDAGPLIKDWLSKHSDEEIVEMGKRGRTAYDQWLHRDKWDSLMTVAIEEALKKDGLL